MWNIHMFVLRKGMQLVCTALEPWGLPNHHPSSYSMMTKTVRVKHIHPFGIWDPKYLWYLNSVIQTLLPILITIRHEFQFISCMEGSLSNVLFGTAHSASNSTDVDVIKFRLVQYDTFYKGQIQQDVSECLMMLTKVINTSSAPYCGSNGCNSTRGFSVWYLAFIYVRKICCLQYMWPEIYFIWV